MSVSHWLERKSLNPTIYDFVIVGAGIAGLSVAYWLQKKDASLKIAVIEKDRIGFGASGRNAGFVTCGSIEHFIKLQEKFGLDKAAEIWKFSEENHRLLLEQIIQDQQDLVDYRHTGSCTVAPSESHWQIYQKTAQVMRSVGIDVFEVGPQEMERDYGVTGFAGGIQYAGDGYIHPVKLLERIRRLLKADFYEGQEVFAIETQSSGQKIKTDLSCFEAKKTILTVNAYLPLLLPDSAALITPGRGQILLTEPLPAFVKGPCYLTKHLCYFRQLPTGHLLIGGFRNLDTENENTYADATTSLIQEALLRFVREHFKLGREARTASRWSGVMGFSPDGQMLLGPSTKDSNLHLMAGCSGHGMGLSFHAAKVLVESIFGGTIPPHLNVNRFKNLQI